MPPDVKESSEAASMPLDSERRDFQTKAELRYVGPRACLAWSAAAVLIFQLAYDISWFSFLIFVYPVCLLQLAQASSARQSFYFGLAVAIANAALQLNCF